MGTVFYLILYVFSLIVPDWWLTNLSNLLPYKVLYILFIVNLVICEIKWIPAVLRRCKKSRIPESLEEVNRFREKVEVKADALNTNKLASWLRRRLYSVKETPATNYSRGFLLFYASRGRYSPLGNIMFHVAFILIIVGVYMSMQYRFEGKIYLIEGQKFTGSYGEYASLQVGPGADFMKMPFQVKDIETKFWESHLLFTDLRADITSGNETFSVWLSEAGDIDGHRISIQEVSYTLNYILRDKSGRTADRGAVNLANFGPGSFDSFHIPGFPYKISVSIYPEAAIEKGIIINRSMNLKNPAYNVKVMKNKRLLYNGVVKGAGLISFDGFTLSFPKVNYIGAFKVVKDPGLKWIIASFVLMIAGLVWRMIFCRNEVAVVRDEGCIVIYARSDYYPVTLMEKCCKVAIKSRENLEALSEKGA